MTSRTFILLLALSALVPRHADAAVELTAVTSISAGAGNQTCAVIAGGDVLCWGYNGYSIDYLGTGSGVEYSALAVPVVGLDASISAVTVGWEESCAVTSGGGVKCWGWFYDKGPYANGLTSGVAAPVAMSLIYQAHYCVVTDGGGLKCWGDNLYGELGNGTTTPSGIPTFVSGLSSGVAAVAAGSLFFTCALTSAGGVKCWGNNEYGQLGDGTTVHRTTPVDVVGLSSGVIAISAGYRYACALLAGGTVKCWGDNQYGELGNGSNTDSMTPGEVSGLTAATAISAGSFHACAIVGSAAKCWGRGGYVGDGTTDDRLTPVAVSGLDTDVTAIAAGGFHSCALIAEGRARCWGVNHYGELGNGERTPLFDPVLVPVVVLKATDANLALSTTNVPTAVASGKDALYDFKVVNNGPLRATGTVLTVPMPANSELIWGAGCQAAGAQVACDVPALDVTKSAIVRVVLRPNAAGPFDVTANVGATQPDPDAANNTVTVARTAVASPAGVLVPRYRLYNDTTKEHLFTTDLNEYDTLGGTSSWVKEGTVGKVLDNPGSFNGVAATPYYRLYNAYARWHHWTTDPNEYYTILQYATWYAEGVDGYILPTSTAGATQLYRLNYPYLSGLHHWTIDQYEYDTLIATYGWVGEGGSGFVVQ